MQVVADEAAAKMHTEKLSGRPEPKLTVGQMIAIAFIKPHRGIKKKKKDLVEADFVKLRAERDDGAWVKGGVVAKVAPKKRKAKAKPQEGAAAAVRPHTDAPRKFIPRMKTFRALQGGIFFWGMPLATGLQC